MLSILFSHLGDAAQLRGRAVHIAQAWCLNGFVDLTIVQPGISKNSMIELASLETWALAVSGVLGVGILISVGGV